MCHVYMALTESIMHIVDVKVLKDMYYTCLITIIVLLGRPNTTLPIDYRSRTDSTPSPTTPTQRPGRP